MTKITDTIQSSFKKRPTFWCLLIISAALLLFYSNSFTTDWHYDDFHHIKENINIRKFSNIPNLFLDPTTFSRNPVTRMTRPLLMTSHAINYQVGLLTSRDGYSVTGYHIVNFIFHLIATLTLFFIILHIFQYQVQLENLDPHFSALFGGLLFGLHTINTETVVYISSRSAGMATMFVFAAFYFYMKSTSSEKTGNLSMALSILFFICGLFTKEIAITFPALLLIYDVTLNRPWFRKTTGTAIYLKDMVLRLLPHGLAALGYIYYRHLVLNENLISRFTTKGGTQAAKDMTSQLATQTPPRN